MDRVRLPTHSKSLDITAPSDALPVMDTARCLRRYAQRSYAEIANKIGKFCPAQRYTITRSINSAQPTVVRTANTLMRWSVLGETTQLRGTRIRKATRLTGGR